MSLAVLALNAAYVAFVASAYTRTLAWLRALLIAGSAFIIVYGVIERIWPMVGWNALIVTTHLIRIASDRRAQNSVNLSPDQADLRDMFFEDVSDFDFNMLWSLGEPAEYHDDVMIRSGSSPGVVSLVTQGVVAIQKDGETLRGLRRGALLGEMTFVNGGVASVDVVAKGHVRVRQWDKQQLTSLEQTHPPSAKAFREMISRDLARKTAI